MFKRCVEVFLHFAFMVASIILIVYLLISKHPYRIAIGCGSILLLLGEMFYLIPRIIANIAEGREYDPILGMSKGFVDVTRVVYFLVIYHVYAQYYEMPYNIIATIVYTAATLSVIMIVLPHNDWIENKPQKIIWRSARNIPFIIFGIILVLVLSININYPVYNPFNFIWISTLLVFLVRIPVFLLEEKSNNTELINLVMYASFIAIMVLGLTLN